MEFFLRFAIAEEISSCSTLEAPLMASPGPIQITNIGEMSTATDQSGHVACEFTDFRRAASRHSDDQQAVDDIQIMEES